MAQQASLIPGIRYKDGAAAIEFLCKAFGFERHLVIPTPDGAIAHAQLVLGDAMMMLGSAPSAELAQVTVFPEEIGGRVTQSVYMIVADPDAHYARAVAAGAVLVRDIADQPQGGRAYSCRDLEGHIWHFGSFNPWQI